MDIESLLNKIRAYNSEANLEVVRRAYHYALKAHQGQKRASGEDYIIHPFLVANLLAELKLSSTTIAAGLLHDVADDTECKLPAIKKEFGPEIAFLVDGVSKLGKIKYRGAERQVENLRKLFLAMAKDIRVALIKFCDRIHNLETLGYLPLEKRHRIALESADIYAPLANRLGVGVIKTKLEDLAFPYIFPNEYKEMMAKVKDEYGERIKYLERIKPIVERELKKESIDPIKINCRAKGYLSLYKKLKKYDNDLEKVYDLVALRIIVNNIEDCYKVLGAIHKLWHPIPDKIKDYIALPKPNGYRSLHTTVICLDGKITEFQIRTAQMHSEAEFGIAAHWYYSEQKGLKAYIKRKISPPPEKEIRWIKQLKDWLEKSKGLAPEQYLESLKIDFLSNRIFVFTPRGDVIDLPEKATPIDFAYAIHGEVGNRCIGAKVNGKMSALSSPLENGDVVEITTDKNKKPSEDWLRIVKTNFAKTQIRKFLKKNSLLPLDDAETKESSLIERLLPKIKFPAKPAASQKKLLIGGQPDLLFKIAKCCSPQPGDETSAYLTKYEGISVHKSSCPNLKKLRSKSPGKIFKSEWK
ncbi:MAG: RelA/SpoT family protein [Candidatus Paceibacterota bacterium]|jgi:GTP pyrophosphokinase